MKENINKKVLSLVRTAIIALFAVAFVFRIIYFTQFNIFAHANIGNVTGSTENGNVMEFKCENGREVKVELYSARTVRIQLSDADGNYRGYNPQYYMVQLDAALLAPVSHTTSEEENGIIKIKTSALEIRVQKSPLRIGMYDLDGNLISRDSDDGMYWSGNTVGVRKVENTENAGGIFGFGSGDHGRRSALNRYEQDFNEFSMSHGRLIAPFFMSTVGYGIFLNTIEESTVFYKHGGGFQTKGYLDYFFMYGPEFKTILNEYAEITGRMEMYGKWAHGFMLSKYGNDNATQAEFLQWIHRLRDEGYPVDSYVFDYGWRGDVADSGQYSAGQKFGKQMWSNDTSKFPDIDAMFAEARSMGIHVGLHNNAGTPEAKGGTMLYDADTAAEWIQSYMKVVEANRGDWFWPDEFDVLGSNTAPTFSAKGAYEAWVASDAVDTRPMFITRGSYAGQHYATAWSGDINNTSEEIGYQIGYSLDAGLVGYWATSHDLGGFMKKPSDELYTRWVSEFGAWNAIMRTHGHDGREPWLYDTTAQETLKNSLRIRYALYPYIYTMAWQGYSQGVPMMRAMILEDGSRCNPDAWDLNKQYYFGDSFLVAPATDTSDTVVSVWLPPETTWYNYYSGEMYSGGSNGKTIRVAAALDEIPVFVKAGAIIPMGPDVDYADEKPLNPLTLDIYPAGSTSYTLYEDDGVTRRYITDNAYTTTSYTCIQSGSDITFLIGARQNHNENITDYMPESRSYNLKFNNIGDVYGVSLFGTQLNEVSTLDEYNTAEQGYWYDAEKSVLYVKLIDTASDMEISVQSEGLKQPVYGNENQGLPTQNINSGDVYEMENASFSSDSGNEMVIATERKGYSGSGYVTMSAGDALEFDVNIVRGGTYDFVLRIHCAKKTLNDNKVRTGSLYLDDGEPEEFSITPTNAEDSSGNGIWNEYTIKGVELEEGRHKLIFKAEGSNAGGYSLDSFTFNRYDTSVDAFSTIGVENVSALNGGVALGTDGGSSVLQVTQDGAWAQFDDINGAGKNGVRIKLKSSTGGSIVIYENGVGDKVLSVIDVPDDGEWHVIEAVSKDTDAEESNIYLEFKSEAPAPDIVVEWFGFVKKVDAYTQIDAISADERNNINMGTSCLINIYNGSWAKFENLDFGSTGAGSVSLYAACGSTSDGGTASIYLDSVSEQNKIAVVSVTGTGSWSVKQTFTAYCADASGVHDVYIVFNTSSGKAVCDFYNFSFTKKTVIEEQTVIELESGTGITNDAGNGLRVDTEWDGYTGTGYVAGWKNIGDYAEVSAVAEVRGLYKIVLRGAAGLKGSAALDLTPRTGSLYIDGTLIEVFSLEVQNSWDIWTEYEFGTVRLDSGLHTFRIVADGDNAGNFNLDNLVFVRITDETQLCEILSEIKGIDGGSYEEVGWEYLCGVVEDAESLLSSTTATQADIDGITQRLVDARQNLVIKVPDNTPDSSEKEPEEPSKKGLNTGAVIGIIGGAAAAVAAAAVTVTVVKRRKGKKQ